MRLGPLILLLLASCRHHILEGSNQPQPPPPPPEAPPSRAFAVARVCPENRPEATLFAARIEAGWTQKNLPAIVQRSRIARLGVFTWDGKRGGSFSVGGAAGDSGRAVGGFAGRKPCDPSMLTPTPVDPLCRAVLGACALGVGWVDPPDPDTVPELAVTTACVADKSLVLDVDRDGTPESFPLEALLGQDLEVTGGPKGGICQKPFFAGRLSDRVDLIGVADLDEDGRMEIVLATQSRWFLYTARQSASRLDRVATLDLTAP